MKMFLWAEKTVGSEYGILGFSALNLASLSLVISPLAYFTRYSTFVNWELWWPNFPILVYFKETQTKPEGQVHFFPVIFVSIKSHWNLKDVLFRSQV